MTTNNDNSMTTNTDKCMVPDLRKHAEHPNLAWATSVLCEKHPDITVAELATLVWHSNMGCYLVEWKGMTLGIEPDGHIHS